jgi:hypothetical protein
MRCFLFWGIPEESTRRISGHANLLKVISISPIAGLLIFEALREISQIKTGNSAINLWAYPPASPEPARHSPDGKPPLLSISLQRRMQWRIGESDGGQEPSKFRTLRNLGGISFEISPFGERHGLRIDNIACKHC